MPAPQDADTVVERLAVGQCGVVSHAQVRAAGLSDGEIRTRVERRRWRRLAPGVLGFDGHPDSLRRRCWIAVLHAGGGSMLSHGTAGALRRMWPIEPGPIELIVPRGRSRGLLGTRRHRPRDACQLRADLVDGLPVTTPARTVVDLSSQMLAPRLAELVEHCEVDRICSVVSVGAELARVRRRGRPGVRRLEAVLDRIGPGDGIPRSELERLGDRVRVAAGLPTPVHEHPLPSARDRSGFVDRAWPEAMLIVEYDGRRWHTRRSEIARDHRRDLESGSVGWQTIRLTWEQLTDDPMGTGELWSATHRRRRELLGAGNPPRSG